ncbi:MAG TPA: hypothetical protein VGM98_05800 [Schlesneria sp.]|jgi:hypothetical protein
MPTLNTTMPHQDGPLDLPLAIFARDRSRLMAELSSLALNDSDTANSPPSKKTI